MEQTQAGTRPAWRGLLRAAAAIDIVVMAVVGLAFRDKEALAFAGVVLLCLLVLRFRSGAGSILLAVVLLNSLAWMAPAAIVNLTSREDVLDVLVPASIAIISLTGAIAAFASVFRRTVTPGRVAGLVPQVAVAVFLVALIAAIVQQRNEPAAVAQRGDLMVEMRNTQFLSDRVEAAAGEIAVAVQNHDLFWHTFTIDDLGVDLGTPTGALRRATFTAGPGSYTFYCKVIGHRTVMKGTLIVR